MKSDKGDNEEFSKTILRSISVMIEGMVADRKKQRRKQKRTQIKRTEKSRLYLNYNFD